MRTTYVNGVRTKALGSARGDAHHEAGHAVVAVLTDFGLGPRGVSIAAQEGALGFTDVPALLVGLEDAEHVLTGAPRPARTPYALARCEALAAVPFVELARRQIEASLAGPCAEARFAGTRWRGLERMKLTGLRANEDDPHAQDIDKALRTFLIGSRVISGGGEIERAIERLNQFFWTAEGWALTRRVATALYRRKSLTAEDVEALADDDDARDAWAAIGAALPGPWDAGANEVAEAVAP